MRQIGTTETIIAEDILALAGEFGVSPAAMHWRKPLSMEEVAQMAQTPEVIERKGRP